MSGISTELGAAAPLIQAFANLGEESLGFATNEVQALASAKQYMKKTLKAGFIPFRRPSSPARTYLPACAGCSPLICRRTSSKKQMAMGGVYKKTVYQKVPARAAKSAKRPTNFDNLFTNLTMEIPKGKKKTSRERHSSHRRQYRYPYDYLAEEYEEEDGFLDWPTLGLLVLVATLGGAGTLFWFKPDWFMQFFEEECPQKFLQTFVLDQDHPAVGLMTNAHNKNIIFPDYRKGASCPPDVAKEAKSKFEESQQKIEDIGEAFSECAQKGIKEDDPACKKFVEKVNELEELAKKWNDYLTDHGKELEKVEKSGNRLSFNSVMNYKTPQPQSTTQTASDTSTSGSSQGSVSNVGATSVNDDV